MKILAIMGSPRGKGAGYRIVKMIEDRMKSAGDVDFSYLFLKDVNLKLCTGCYACLAKGEDKCPLKDDREAIEQMILASDGIILSTPMHVLNVSWLMKNFIDRFAYANHRPRFHGRKVMIVVNMGGGDSPRAAFSALRFVLGGSQVVHKLAVATPPWPQTKRTVAKKERDIDRAAKKFYKACLDASLPVPTLTDLLFFYIRQKTFLQCRQYLPADHAFYSKKTYYYDTKIGPLKSAVAKILAKVYVFLNRGKGPGSVEWPPQ